VELAAAIDARLPSGETITEVRPGIILGRSDEPHPRTPAVYPMSACFLAQGAKRVHAGGRTWDYDPGHFLLTRTDATADSEILEASPTHPILGMVVRLDPRRLAAAAANMGSDAPLPEEPGAHAAISSHPIDAELTDVTTRMVRASARDSEWRALEHGLHAELYYRLLCGPAGPLLRARISNSTVIEQVSRAANYIREHLADSIDIDAIAEAAGVSQSGLHAKFKAVFGKSPMQYAKRLRLDRARALILTGRQVSQAALDVGYASPSQFSRDFSRHYGVAPSKVRPIGASPDDTEDAAPSRRE